MSNTPLIPAPMDAYVLIKGEWRDGKEGAEEEVWEEGRGIEIGGGS